MSSMIKGRKPKLTHTFYMGVGVFEILKKQSLELGISMSEVVTLSVMSFDQSRNIINTMTNSPRLVIGEAVIEREGNVYQDIVDKCLLHMANMKWKGRIREITRTMEVCNMHLENDFCSQEEREVFLRYVAWAKDKLEMWEPE